jgi:hypothetical protein
MISLFAVPLAVALSAAPLTPPGRYSETAVASDPADPLHAVAAFQNPYTTPIVTETTFDGGKTWAQGELRNPEHFKCQGDPRIAMGPDGNPAIAFIAFDRLGTPQYWAHRAGRNGIFVAASSDGGRSFAPPIAVIAHPGPHETLFEDKPDIAVDATSGRFRGRIYVAWTQFQLDRTITLSSVSKDGGRSFSVPLMVSAVPGLPRDDNGALEGTTLAVSPEGAVVLAWSDRDGIVLATSRDGGETFSTPRRVLSTAPAYFDVVRVSRANGFPLLAFDHSRGAARDRLYLLWSDFRNGDIDVFLAASDDEGSSFRAPVRVNTDALHDGDDQFFPGLAVDPSDGAVVVSYDSEQDLSHCTTAVLARSTDGGDSFTETGFPAAPFDSRGIFLGDYTAVAASSGRAYAVWTEVPQESRKTRIMAGVATWR